MSTSTFSYAQAAKGQLATQVATSQQSPNQSQTPSIAGNPSRDTNATDGSTRAPSVAVSASSNDVDSRSARGTSAKPEAARLNGVETNRDDANIPTSNAGSVSSFKVGTDMSSVDEVAKLVDQRERPRNSGSDTSEQHESKKGRKPKKGRPLEKDAETVQESEIEGPPPKIELSEAPLPSVNVWVQRQQAAKVKAVDQPTASISADHKARPSQGEAGDGLRAPFNGKQGARRDGEPSRNGAAQGPKRAAPRGARVQEKESETNLLASNPASWPTPETAAVNLKSQPQSQPEKSDKDEKDEAGTAKPKQKKEWVQLPNFVPTVKFETTMPSRGPRGGGRVGGSRGGRDAASSHHAASNSSDRVQDTTPGSRTSSGPKRAPVEGSGTREGRKNNHSHGDHPRSSKESIAENTNGEQLRTNQLGVVNGTNHEQPGNAISSQPEENTKTPDPHKETRAHNNRDAHPQGQNSSNHRGGERPRGGGRGRGGFNGNNPNGMPHYVQSSYLTQHQAYQYQSNGSRHVPSYGVGQQPMPYPFPGQPGPGQRKSANGNRRQGSGRVPTLPPMNVPYDANIYSLPNNGMYAYDPNNLVSIARSQVEYYFSVENCVKDWFLRRHMDSLGFVPLQFIASFNRMRELLVDHNILRQACMESKTVEIVMGGDGVERVRKKEGWEKWVIQDKSQRDPGARHDGPSTWQQFGNGFQHPLMSPHYPVEVPPVFSPTSEHGFTPYTNGHYSIAPQNVPSMNGINGHTRPRESQLSAAVPEFSPSATATFNGINSASQADSENTRISGDQDLNGTHTAHIQPISMANGVLHSQPETNGVSHAH